jgi:hypothetical protein
MGSDCGKISNPYEINRKPLFSLFLQGFLSLPKMAVY